MGLFNKYNKIEQKLLDEHSQMFVMMGITDAIKMAKDMLNQAIERAKKEGTYSLPNNFGSIILKEEKTEDSFVEKFAETIRKTLPIKRVDGVTDNDIKWWWNLNEVERNMILAVDEMARLALLAYEIQNSTEINAAKIVWKFHPVYTYGVQKDAVPSWVKEEDLPLPIELKERVVTYSEKRSNDNLEKYKKDMETSSTFNALIRREIKAGNLGSI